MILFAVCLAAAVALILVMERFVQPRVVSRPFLHKLNLLSAMPVVVLYLTVFMISYRPVFSLVVTLLTVGAIVVVNNSKYAALQEPLVFSDFALLRQAVQHPALYVKYIGVWNIVGVCVLSVLAVVGAILYEPPAIERPTIEAYVPTLIYLMVVIGLIYAVTRGPLRGAFADLLRRFGPTTDVTRDMDKLNLVVCLIVYFFLANERSVIDTPPAAAPAPKAAVRKPKNLFTQGRLPDVVAVQSESFFDARRLHPSIDQALLARYDALSAKAAYRGRLVVPAWGANTMRTEFAFLSGLPNEALGFHRFNPYLQLCKQPVWTLVHQLRSMGYRTVCVHPFHASFFDRKTVYPNLGFDLFLDIADFVGAETYGPYVSDVAVADKIVDVLGSYDGPQFIFAITMENHGKWERDRLVGTPADGREPLGSFELGHYLSHLANTDQLVDRISDALTRRPGDGVFCLFGDHLPSLPDVFQQVGWTDQRTDYFVWKKSGRHPRELDVSADALGRLVLDAVLNQVNHVAAGGPAATEASS